MVSVRGLEVRVFPGTDAGEKLQDDARDALGHRDLGTDLQVGRLGYCCRRDRWSHGLPSRRRHQVQACKSRQQRLRLAAPAGVSCLRWLYLDVPREALQGTQDVKVQSDAICQRKLLHRLGGNAARDGRSLEGPGICQQAPEHHVRRFLPLRLGGHRAVLHLLARKGVRSVGVGRHDEHAPSSLHPHLLHPVYASHQPGPDSSSRRGFRLALL
mmetsp:Transcript_12942/g.24447  ORF Transcript_12942/g.24447 Transcript_12942/m.24447 type:complete len:213 (-) Transcript_12942:249-887(-)